MTEYVCPPGESTSARIRQGLHALAKDWLDRQWNADRDDAGQGLRSLLAAAHARTGGAEHFAGDPRPMDLFRAMVDEIRSADRESLLAWAAEVNA